MKWKKLGHVFRPQLQSGWQANSALTPTPILLNADTIRVYAGFRDEGGISRIGYVDLDAQDPARVKAIAKNPVLNTGRAGCFDDNGVILGDIIFHEGIWRMYYVGFQLVKQVKFLAFTGLAESYDGGETFQRVSEAPILDRTEGAATIRAIHSVRYEEGIWRAWYALGDDWEFINGTPFPRYHIWHTESTDGIHFPHKGTLCIDVEGQEYRIGRPSVYKHDNHYYMLYTKGSTEGTDYFPGVATSLDGLHWQRQDHTLGLALSEEGFDSLHLCYPRLIQSHGKTYAVYNGNHMGKEGFGIAELVEW